MEAEFKLARMAKVNHIKIKSTDTEKAWNLKVASGLVFNIVFLVVVVFVVYALQDCLAMDFLKETAYVA